CPGNESYLAVQPPHRASSSHCFACARARTLRLNHTGQQFSRLNGGCVETCPPPSCTERQSQIDGLLWLCPGIVSYTEFSLRGQRTRSRDEGKRSHATNHQVCTKAELERCLGRGRGCGLCDRVAWKGARADKDCGGLCQPWRAAMAGIHCQRIRL